jgi:hypothetical protein
MKRNRPAAPAVALGWLLSHASGKLFRRVDDRDTRPNAWWHSRKRCTVATLSGWSIVVTSPLPSKSPVKIVEGGEQTAQTCAKACSRQLISAVEDRAANRDCMIRRLSVCKKLHLDSQYTSCDNPAACRAARKLSPPDRAHPLAFAPGGKPGKTDHDKI